MDLDKKKALDMAMRQIEKDFGKGSIMKLGEASAKMNMRLFLQVPYPWILLWVWAVFPVDVL